MSITEVWTQLLQLSPVFFLWAPSCFGYNSVFPVDEYDYDSGAEDDSGEEDL